MRWSRTFSRVCEVALRGKSAKETFGHGDVAVLCSAIVVPVKASQLFSVAQESVGHKRDTLISSYSVSKGEGFLSFFFSAGGFLRCRSWKGLGFEDLVVEIVNRSHHVGHGGWVRGHCPGRRQDTEAGEAKRG